MRKLTLPKIEMQCIYRLSRCIVFGGILMNIFLYERKGLLSYIPVLWATHAFVALKGERFMVTSCSFLLVFVVLTRPARISTTLELSSSPTVFFWLSARRLDASVQGSVQGTLHLQSVIASQNIACWKVLQQCTPKSLFTLKLLDGTSLLLHLSFCTTSLRRNTSSFYFVFVLLHRSVDNFNVTRVAFHSNVSHDNPNFFALQTFATFFDRKYRQKSYKRQFLKSMNKITGDQ